MGLTPWYAYRIVALGNYLHATVTTTNVRVAMQIFGICNVQPG